MIAERHITFLVLCTLLPRGRTAGGWKADFLSRDPWDAKTQRMRNLRRILEFVQSSPDFRPLTISVLSSGSTAEIPNCVGEFMARNSIDVFQMTAEEFPANDRWLKRDDLTWIFLVEDNYALRSFIEYQRTFWKGTQQYVIVFYDEKAALAWKTVLETLWKRYNVYRVIVTLASDDFKWFVKYLPFELESGEFGVTRRIYFDEGPRDSSVLGSLADVGEFSFVAKGSTVFNDLLNMNGYPVNVTVFWSLTMRIKEDEANRTTFSGLDAQMMNLLEASLKCKFQQQVIEPSPYKDPFVTALRDIEERQTEIVFTGFFVKTYENFTELDFTTGIYQDKLCFVAPHAKYIPRAYMPVIPFPRRLWSILAVYNVAVTVLWVLLNHWSRALRRARSSGAGMPAERRPCQREFTKDSSGEKAGAKDIPAVRRPAADQRKVGKFVTRNDPPDIHPYLLGLFNLIVFAIHPLKGGDNVTQRIFLVGVLFFSVLIGGLYQSRLVSSFSKPYYYPQIDTVRDVIDSNYTLVTKYANLKSIFADAKSPPDERKILPRLQLISIDESTYAKIVNEHVIGLRRLLSMEMDDLTEYYDEYGNSLLHVVGECPATYMLAYVVTPSSPYVERLDSLILRMQQSGIVHAWLVDMKLTSDKTNRLVRMTRMERKIKLSFEHYSLTFLGLFLGLVSSTLVFLGELRYAGRLRPRGAKRKRRLN